MELDYETRKAIEQFYWDEVEPMVNGYGDERALTMIFVKYGMRLDWVELHQIIKEFGYAL